MYIFDAIETSFYGGISTDRIPDAIKNQFSMIFGNDALDNRLQVKISERQIRFFYYDYDYEEKEWGSNGVKDNDYFKEVGFITLTRPKDTGNDILAFPQNIGDLYLYDWSQGCVKCIEQEDGVFFLMDSCVDSYGKEFYSFPFIDKYKKKKKQNQKNRNTNNYCCWNDCKEMRMELFRCFMRCCLLNFICEFEDRGMFFGGSPIYDEVRDKLRESDVYKLLSAKIQYTQYLYKGKHLSRNQEKYTYYTQKFADCLMDKRLNKIILPDNYGISGTEKKKKWIEWINRKWDWFIANMSSDSNDKQGWFYNPEEELERILDRNRQQECEDGSVLKDELVSKIRRYMYSKHAIDRAMTTYCEKCFFWVVQMLMLFWSIVMVGSSIGLASCRWNWFYENYLFIIFGVVIIAFVFILGVISRDLLNTILPRIIVAEATAWLTVGFASIVLKGMPWVISANTIFKAFVVVFIVVGAFVFGKSKQHSPYFRNGENIKKTLLILNHSVFFALALGCVFRFCFYDNLLRTNNVLSEEIYEEHFDAVNKYMQRLEDVEKLIDEYHTFARGYDSTCDYHNHNAIVKNIKRVARETGAFDFMIFACNIDKMVSTNDVEIVCNNLCLINRITPNLKIEIRETKNHLTNKCEKTLRDWAAVNSKNNIKYTNSEYVNDLIYKAKKQKCSILVGDKQLYPALLVFHALIVLVLAFVTQLFISDKAITEPL